jgi:hypothetical protein
MLPVRALMPKGVQEYGDVLGVGVSGSQFRAMVENAELLIRGGGLGNHDLESDVPPCIMAAVPISDRTRNASKTQEKGK